MPPKTSLVNSEEEERNNWIDNKIQMYSWDLKELLVLAFTLHYLDCDGLNEWSFLPVL